MGKSTVTIFFKASLLSLCLLTTAVSADTLEQTSAQNIYRRLTGFQIPITDPQIVNMTALLKQGNPKAAALIAAEDPKFLSGTIVPLAAKLGSFEASSFAPFNDFQALFVGIVRDNIDARELLSANYAYQFSAGKPRSRNDNNNYSYYDFIPAKLNTTELIKVSPQWSDQTEKDVAGLLTTRGWAEAHYNAGTNRRAVERTFNMFLCSPIEKWRDITVSDEFVGRDVDRVPSGDPTTFQNTCRGCHGSMDGLRPAFGHFDFVNDKMIYMGKYSIAPKMNIHNTVFPHGYAVANDDWVNQTVESYDQYFGWRGAVNGSGIHEFGQMIANSKAYTRCFANRAFTAICRRDANASENKLIQGLAEDFEKDKYSIKSLFANTATKAGCF
jgi:hypothetical protein